MTCIHTWLVCRLCITLYNSAYYIFYACTRWMDTREGWMDGRTYVRTTGKAGGGYLELACWFFISHSTTSWAMKLLG